MLWAAVVGLCLARLASGQAPNDTALPSPDNHTTTFELPNFGQQDLPDLPPFSSPDLGRVAAPEAGEGAVCDLVIEPPEPRHGCYWEVLRDASACLTGYRPRCMAALPQDCGPAPPAPKHQQGCAWISLHSESGCIVSFVCEPDDCAAVEAEDALGSACLWLPVRDARGCVQEYKCQPAGRPEGDVASFDADPFDDLPALPVQAQISELKPRLPVLSQTQTLAVPPVPSSLRRQPIAIPPVLPLPAPIPALPQRRRRARLPLAARAHFPSRPLCPAPPFKPANTKACNWAPVFAPLGCVVDWRCVEVRQAPPKPCPKAPKRPRGAKNCLWVTVTDDRGCVLKYECEPVKRPRCPAPPNRPEDTGQCAYLAIRNTNKCVIHYECIPKNLRLPHLLPSAPLIAAPRPRLRPALLSRGPLLRHNFPVLRSLSQPKLSLPPLAQLRPKLPLQPKFPLASFGGALSPGFGLLGPLKAAPSKQRAGRGRLALPQRVAVAGPIPRVTIPVAKPVAPLLPAASPLPPPVFGGIPKISVPVPVPRPELVDPSKPLPARFQLGGFPGFRGFDQFQAHYQKLYAQQARAHESRILQGGAGPAAANLVAAPQLPGQVQLGGSGARGGQSIPVPVLTAPNGAPGAPAPQTEAAAASAAASSSFLAGFPAFPGFPAAGELSSAPSLEAPSLGAGPQASPFKLSVALDQHELCCWWAQIGECDNNLFYMRTGCQRSCGTPGCDVESAESCEPSPNVQGCPWSPANPPPLAQGPPSELVASGRDSTGCLDTQSHQLCTFWKGLGYCDSEQKLDYIADQCPVTCGKC